MPDGRQAGVSLILIFVTLAGAALRVGPAVLWPIRHDEVLTWLTAQADPTAFLLWAHHPHHPPLSYALARLSTTLFGTDVEWALRLPSLLAGMACIPLAYAIGRALGSRAGGILLAILIAFDPLLVDQARLARMYSLYALLFLAALYGLTHLEGRGRIPRWRWGLTGLGLGAIFWTHVLGLVLWGGVALGIATGRGDGERRLAAVKAMGLAVVLSAVGLDWLWRHAVETIRSSASGQEDSDPRSSRCADSIRSIRGRSPACFSCSRR